MLTGLRRVPVEARIVEKLSAKLNIQKLSPVDPKKVATARVIEVRN